MKHDFTGEWKTRCGLTAIVRSLEPSKELADTVVKTRCWAAEFETEFETGHMRPAWVGTVSGHECGWDENGDGWWMAGELPLAIPAEFAPLKSMADLDLIERISGLAR